YGGCTSDSVACQSYGGGPSAAISENLYGQSNGISAQACGTCWALTPKADMNGVPLKGAQSIVVRVNSLCPAQGNEKCAQSGLSGKNSL
ncbi:MAG: hypothetical protein Q9174_007385, partial [Haloplaca sp. 1 TL-2023]